MNTNGSSPRMWGTQQRMVARLSSRRFIPTHVGNTFFSGSAIDEDAVHPHACGEHALNSHPDGDVIGSSPRMWGTLDSGLYRMAYHRFIPTHVGNTGCLAFSFLVFSVHPHACGEHGISPVQLVQYHGSSPRMWGTHHLMS